MMLTLYGLPHNFHYKDVKALIRTQCEIIYFILDNLSFEAGLKKIRVGLASDTEGNHLIKCLDGFQVQGCTLKVVPIAKTQSVSEAAPIDSYQRDIMQPSYDAVQPSPWINQGPQWQENQAEQQGTYQHFPQNRPFVQPQQQQTIPIVNIQPANRFHTQQNYEKPITIMKDNFQGPQYVQQQNQPAQFQNPQQPWTPYMQQSQQFNQVSSTNQELTRHGNRQHRECEVRSNSIEADFNKVSVTSSHSQFGPPSNRQVPQQITGRRMSPDREISTGRGELRRISPGRNLHEQRISPSRAMGHLRNMSPPDRRRELGHNRRMSPPEHHLSSGRPVLLSGRYDTPSGQAPSGGHVSPAGRQMSQGARHISSPGRQMPQGRRYISPPGRQMSQGGRHISPPGRHMPQSGRHISPPGRQMPQGSRQNSPSGRQIPQGGRHISPPRRQISQGGRNILPTGHQMVQGSRHISPPGRQIPQGGRHISPPGRQMPQSGRHISPIVRQIPQDVRHISPPGRHKMPLGGRQISPPGRQMPQGSRHISPPGRQVPQGSRYVSPSGGIHTMPQGGRNISPPGRQMPQGGRHISPLGRQMPQSGRHISPIRRQIPQDVRHISPPGRQMPQGSRHISPPGRQVPKVSRHISPSGLHTMPQGGRHISPPGRQMPQVGRHLSPPGRQVLLSAPSSGRQVLQGRLGSPPGRMQISRQDSPPNRHVPPNESQKSPGRPGGRHLSPSGRRISPTWRRISPSGRQVLIPARNISPSGRFSPPGRTVLISRISPGRRVVETDRPSGRQMSPNRPLMPHDRAIPSGRVVSPGRRFSPSGRRVSPSGRRISPSGRPLRQHSPDIRRVSPMRQDSRQHIRYSPPQHKGPMGKYDQADSRSSFKQAFELYDKASDQGMFSSDFRPNVLEDKPYPRKSPPRESRWQEREQFPSRNADRSLGPHKTEPNRFSEQQRAEDKRKKSRSLTRESIRDRSLIRAPKRHSPSPRRSWALEKRNCPDIKEAPPPPIWPGQDSHFQRPDRPHYSGRNIKEDPWQHKMDNRHRGHPNFEEKDSISNWKPQPSDRSPQRLAEDDKNKEKKHFDKDDAYYRVREQPRDIPHREDSRQNYEEIHHPYKNETPLRPGNAGKEYLQKQEYKEKEAKQDLYTDVRNRNAAHQTNPKYRITTQDRNPKDCYGEEPTNNLSDTNKEGMSKITKEKREKAAAEIAMKVMERFGGHLVGKHKPRRALIFEEVKTEVGRMLYNMYRNRDVPDRDVKWELKASKYPEVFSRSFRRVMNKIKNKNLQIAGNFNQRMKEAQPQKRPQPPAKPLPVKVTKRDETHTQINEDKAASTKPSHAAPKQPKKTRAAAKQPEKTQAAAKQPEKTRAAAKQPEKTRAAAKQPEKTQAAKPTPKPTQVEAAKPAPTKKVVSDSPKSVPENKAKAAPTTPKDAPKTEAKRQSGELKVLTVAQINEQSDNSQNKIESKAEDRLETQTTKSEDTTDGNYYELNKLMSNVLKKELRGIMDKVWSCLLVQPDTPAEVMAVDLIRYEAVDHIRDAIGLNVAKRLLNVFNPLFVKIQFSCRPENGCLTTFLKQHNIKSFKRIPNAENTFAAQLQDIADFDALCYTNYIKCGSADLKITPYYKFTQCPPNLKINLDDDDYYVYPTDDEYDDEDNDIDTQMFDEFDKETPIEKVEAVKPDKATDQPKPESQNIKDNKSEQSKSDGKIVEVSKTTSYKEVNKDTPNKEGTKSLSEKLSNAKPKESPSKNVNNEKPQSMDKGGKNNEKSKIAETTAKASPINKEVNEKSNEGAIKEKNNAEIKDNPNKDKTIEHKAKAISEENKKNISQAQKRKQSVVNNDVRKKILKSKPKRNTYEVIDEAYDDNNDEELEDEDILALLSGGVVLDECGSDD